MTKGNAENHWGTQWDNESVSLCMNDFNYAAVPINPSITIKS